MIKQVSCRTAVAAACLVMASWAQAAVVVQEGFDNGIPSSWGVGNFSTSPAGPGWFQGSGDVDHFPAHSGEADSYAATTAFISTDPAGDPFGTAYSVLASPLLDLTLSTTVTFFTRTLAVNAYDEFLFVTVDSYDGNTGKLLDYVTIGAVGPVAGGNPYPNLWTGYTFSLPAQAAGTVGFVNFEYLVDTSIEGNYIGVDTVEISQNEVPEPSTHWLVLASGLIALSVRQRQGRR